MGNVESRDVDERLSYARRRADDLLALNLGDFAGAEGSERQQLVQEFFFHLVGAIEILAQVVNDQRHLGLDPEYVSVRAVIKDVRGDPLEPLLRALYVNPRGKPLSGDPYQGDGLLFRIYNFRAHLAHRRANPFHFKLPGRTAHFRLDPRDPRYPAAEATIQEELEAMLALVESRCRVILDRV